MSQSEKAIVRALISAVFPREHVDWMVDSCPSIERCKQVCLEERRRRR